MKLPKFYPTVNSSLPLFAWADSRDRRVCRPVPTAARIIAIRHCLPVDRAALVCELAGIGGAE
jgi:hypothetical protein